MVEKKELLTTPIEHVEKMQRVQDERDVKMLKNAFKIVSLDFEKYVLKREGNRSKKMSREMINRADMITSDYVDSTGPVVIGKFERRELLVGEKRGDK